MALTHVGTCSAGNHHTFVDDDGVEQIFTTDQLTEEAQAAQAAQARSTEKLEALPADVMTRIDIGLDPKQ